MGILGTLVSAELAEEPGAAGVLILHAEFERPQRGLSGSKSLL